LLTKAAHPIDKLEARGIEISPTDPTVLFRWLTENTTEHRGRRTSNDKLFDILKRNLGSPKGREEWGRLSGENRAIQVVTAREHVWNMSTAAVRLSEKMFESWVTRADEMKAIGRHPAFRVSRSLQTGKDG
jgi:hypothetical protein